MEAVKANAEVCTFDASIQGSSALAHRWALEKKPELSEMEVVHGRLIYLNPKVACKSFTNSCCFSSICTLC